jgi:hypothetical protein
MADSFSEGEDSVRDFVGYMKNRIDEYHIDPLGEEDEDFFDWFGEDVELLQEYPDPDKVVTVEVCDSCARPYILLSHYTGYDPIYTRYHQIDSYGNQSGDYCKTCGGGNK